MKPTVKPPRWAHSRKPVRVMVLLAVVAFAGLAGKPGSAVAQPSESRITFAQRAEAVRLNEAGLAEYRAGHWEQALTYFRRAIEIWPTRSK